MVVVDRPDEAYYVAYGSNMSSRRFGTYLDGGRPAGGAWRYPGCRDSTRPRGRAAVWLPGRVYFAGVSAVWGGGTAFYDPDAPGRAPGCGHRITVAQLADVITQEMHRDPHAAGDIEHLLRDTVLGGVAGTRVSLGPGRYETIVVLEPIDGLPAATFTCARAHAPEEHSHPSAAYLEHVVDGLAEAHGWARADALAYLS